jgi:hypothetical protein
MNVITCRAQVVRRRLPRAGSTTRPPLFAAWGVALCCCLAVIACAADEKKPKVGDTSFMAYEGEQNWPTSQNAAVINDYAVPIYIGLPTKPYKVLGRIYDPRTEGIEVVGRAFDEGLEPEKRRHRNCANQAKQRGADAVIVTNHEKLVKALGVTEKEIKATAPLFHHRDKLVLAIQFK